jgi:hypothetical protein
MKMAQQEQKRKSTKQQQEEYYKTFDEIRSITSRTKQAYVPILCKRKRAGWQDMSNEDLQNEVVNDCENKLGWNPNTVYGYIPTEFRASNVNIEARKIKKFQKIERENAPKVEQALKYFEKITELPIEEIEEPEPEPLSDQEYHDLGLATYGTSDKTMHTIRNDIHQHARMLFRSLCDDKEIPYQDEDLLVDYIKPTREYRLTIAYELDKSQRAHLHNVMHAVIEAAEDMIDQIDKADKK